MNEQVSERDNEKDVAQLASTLINFDKLYQLLTRPLAVITVSRNELSDTPISRHTPDVAQVPRPGER